jgi:small subunit ribosomal protein S1
VRLTNFGAFVELAEGIEGLIHVSEFDETQGGGEKIELAVEQTYPMKIIKLSPGERKIGLSLRALRLDQERQDWQHYADGGSVGATIAEHLKNLQ